MKNAIAAKPSGPVNRVFAARALRAFGDGFIAVVLPAYLLALGHGELEVGLISTATLLGSAAMTLAVGRWGHRYSIRRLLLTVSLLMCATGWAFASVESLWPLLIIAFVSMLNPGGGDASPFLPLDHTLLATTPAEQRTSVFARYSFIGSVCGAIGALAAGVPDWLAAGGAFTMLGALRAMFVLYGALGLAVWLLYVGLPDPQHDTQSRSRAALGPSRRVVWRLAALFSVDSFAGGLVLNSLLALWLFERFGMSLASAGAFFFWTGLFSATSQLLAAPLAQRIGLVNTMVFTHIPANLCLIGAALAPTLTVGTGAAARTQRALADGCARAQRFRDVGGDARRAPGGRELHRRAAQPRLGREPLAYRGDVRGRRDGRAARRCAARSRSSTTWRSFSLSAGPSATSSKNRRANENGVRPCF